MARLVARKKAKNEESNKEAQVKSIWEIINYKTPFELIYSGVESEGYYNALYDCGVRNFLMSYHYLQKSHINMEKRFGGKSVRLFIDSGAHTYQNDPKYAEVTVEEWEKHLQKYLRWVEKNKEFIFAIASFDFENVVGGDKVDEWNRKYFEPFMLRTGIPVCFVWHQDSAHSWEEYCQRYPYVGFSSVNTEGEAIELTEYKQKLRTAEKHGSVVHGFGMTRTGMLTELPFYSVDSTTWMVGLQYGELNYWTGTKMTRLKKDKWKGSMLSGICSKYNLDEDKMLQEDVTEIIRANIFAFMDAVDFIQHHLRGMMYWLKAKAVVNDVDNLPADFYPSCEWLFSEESDNYSQMKKYAEKMNINPDYEDAITLVENCTMIMNWGNPAYKELQDKYEESDFEILRETHNFLINRVVGTTDEMVADLQLFFRECIEGKNEKLLHMGTNFDREQKERDNYIEEDEERELVPMTLQQVRDELSQYLPVPGDDGTAPEIDELDAEIFAKADIVPTFDEHGKFIKGQKSVRAPKKVYSKKFPKLACSNCFMAAKCPEYKDGYVCAYNKMFERFDTRNMTDIIESMQGIVGHGMKRLQIAMMFEMMNGNIDPAVTGLMDNTMKNLDFLRNMYENASAEVIKQSRVIRADGSVEENTSVHNPRSGGILEKIFGGMGNNDKEKEVIDVEVKE